MNARQFIAKQKVKAQRKKWGIVERKPFDPEQWVSQYWCGCGQPDEAYTVLVDILEYSQSDDRGDNREALLRKYGVGAVTLILYLFDGMGLTNHGTSVTYGWLSEDGRALLAYLKANRDTPEIVG